MQKRVFGDCTELDAVLRRSICFILLGDRSYFPCGAHWIHSSSF